MKWVPGRVVLFHEGCWEFRIEEEAGANTVASDQDQEPIRIWILTCRWFLTVGILPGSWWAHHELGRGGWWFRDPEFFEKRSHPSIS